MKYRIGHQKVERVVYRSEKPSRTQQCFREDCNINNILVKWRKTGIITHQREDPGYYADVTAYAEYQDALHIVMEAETMFADLPSDIRKRFGNDPTQYVEFAMNPENSAEMVKLGLAVAKPDPTSNILDVTGRTDTNDQNPRPEGEDDRSKDEPKGRSWGSWSQELGTSSKRQPPSGGA